MDDLKSSLRPALVSLAVFTLLLGVGYPAFTTAVAQGLFPHQANGSLIVERGKVLGSELIGQPFTDPGYFWSRPSGTATVAYNAMTSSGTNAGPLSSGLRDAVKGRIDALHAVDPDNHARIPVDLVTASGSGLDPHLSPAAIYYQAGRVARVRGIAEDEVRALIAAHVESRQLGIFGEPRVNVLALNRALDRKTGAPAR